MSKAVLISIRPKWCEKIANGKKTIEIRKRRPKIETPFKCYIYCTKPSRSKMWRAGEYMCFNDDELYRDTKGKIKYGCSIELMACEHAKWGKGRTFEGCEFDVQRPPQSFMYVEELP